jgi:SAM-dependent methyltransferase
MALEPYEEFYYSYQTQGRGLRTPQELISAFKVQARAYEELIGPLVPRRGRAVDLACGYGNMLFVLKEFGLDAIGFDLDKNQVELARSIGLDARIGDVLADLKELTQLDLISAIDVIEHLKKNDAVQLLRNVYSALAPQGVFLLRCPCADGFTGAHDIFNDMTHRWGATSVVVQQMLLATGFKRIELIDISLPRYPKTGWSKARAFRIRTARKIGGFMFRLMGVATPRIWSNSVIALAWRN